MSKLLNIFLIELLWVSGIIALVTCGTILYRSYYGSELVNIFLPGILLFLSLAITSLMLASSIKKYPLVLASCTLVLGICILFVLSSSEELLRELHMLYYLLNLDGLTLVAAAIFQMMIGIVTLRCL